ncbi:MULTISPECIES: D-alanyl-D-alanine carboxypeptidase [Moorena]|uniref:D-alanyl-D-alanine carboxypeptidase n=1 Tax=Moorena producens 3L TaxID=489825 RepID=F4XND8_9CYAN|nr:MULTISPECIES: D-alanyl-D-alanine carboxypeptidase [Moorena]NEQ16415.1 D-alanyl-D-alanine carboxypeptidase [Moorena sp. SIO3E2]EGJ34197.1 D-alanyl-D-alanine carboxypeptidase [Moorena producens 3L]NEP68847.1 D-alanyl-D-alanine carboxypeptidase [Moorena sp. SIO3A5]NES41117.1 D-alanyl-D-alanine carboxypeptidase [Moorena sp. SIO2C4]OLT65740.1 D-alanyl-D-alanine carboxypeptidase [Moorena producens 3L]
MLKTKTYVTGTLSTLLLALVIGCNGADSPKGVSPSPDPESSQSSEPENALKVIPKPDQPLTVAETNPIPGSQQSVDQYLKGLSAKGMTKTNQGIWIESGDTLLANHQGTIPLPAASLTKAATTLAALSTFGPDHQFITQFSATGPIENGVLQGDLVVQGSEDPFFVWEEAIAVGNQLNQLGIKQVTGNLVIVGKFYMNFETLPLKAGTLLKQGLNGKSWPPAAETQYQTLPPGTPRPEIAIAGSVQVVASPPDNLQPLVRQYSFPLAELLKKMNRYSNNKMADMLANTAGGAKVVARKAAEAAGVPQSEISLINGSGLGEENRMSPRAVTAVFLAIERYLKQYNMTVADVFAIVGQDKGILNERPLPNLAVVKSGSLNYVSTLAGALPTQTYGTVWFAVMNSGGDYTKYRTQQEVLLKELVTKWGVVQSVPSDIKPSPQRIGKRSFSEIVR